MLVNIIRPISHDLQLLGITLAGGQEGEGPITPIHFAYRWVCIQEYFLMCTHICTLLSLLNYSVSSLSASWLHLSSCWFYAGPWDWAAAWVHLNGSRTFPPVSSICPETLCSEGSFPLTCSPATSARGRSLTTSAVKGNGLWKKAFFER